MQFKFTGHQLGTIVDFNEMETIGTGFVFLKDDWVVTAAHVVIQEGVPKPSIGFSSLNRDLLL
jgi:hypothetical protein